MDIPHAVVLLGLEELEALTLLLFIIGDERNPSRSTAGHLLEGQLEHVQSMHVALLDAIEGSTLTAQWFNPSEDEYDQDCEDYCLLVSNEALGERNFPEPSADEDLYNPCSFTWEEETNLHPKASVLQLTPRSGYKLTRGKAKGRKKLRQHVSSLVTNVEKDLFKGSGSLTQKNHRSDGTQGPNVKPATDLFSSRHLKLRTDYLFLSFVEIALCKPSLVRTSYVVAGAI